MIGSNVRYGLKRRKSKGIPVRKRLIIPGTRKWNPN